MGNLLAAFEKGKALSGKKRAFTLAGESIELPRLNLGNRAAFEMWMKKRGVENFSLSSIRNRAMLKIAQVAQEVKDEWAEEGLPEQLSDDTRDELMKRISEKMGPYTDALLSPLDTNAQTHAIYLALRQEFGAKWGQGDDSLDLTEENVTTILNATPSGVISRAALFVLGLEDWTDEIPAPAETVDEEIERSLGDPKASEKPPATTSTTTKPSPSSASTGEKAPTGSGS